MRLSKHSEPFSQLAKLSEQRIADPIISFDQEAMAVTAPIRFLV